MGERTIKRNGWCLLLYVRITCRDTAVSTDSNVFSLLAGPTSPAAFVAAEAEFALSSNSEYQRLSIAVLTYC